MRIGMPCQCLCALVGAELVRQNADMHDRLIEVRTLIRDAMVRKGISENELERRTGVLQSTINRILSGRSKNPRIGTLRPILEFLEIELPPFTYPHQHLLRENTPDANVEPGPAIVGKIPLISWVQAGAFVEVHDPYHVGEFEKEVETTKRMSSTSFALRVQGDSMQAPEGLSIPEGFIIHVDPERAWTNGDLVVAKLHDEQAATFKKLVIDGDRMYLKPLNPRYPIIECTGEVHIVGVVVHAGLDF